MAFGSGSIDDIPYPESGDAKEVFAFFGLAAYAAQVLEAELTNLLVATHLAEAIPATSDDVDALFSAHFAMTFGRLLTLARQRVQLPTATEELIKQALVARNRLIHGFFGEHSEDFMSAAGRREMARELRETTILFRRADEAATDISRSLFAALGITEDRIQSELEGMVRAARARDAI